LTFSWTTCIFDRGADVHTSDRGFDYIFNVQSVSGDGVAVDFEILVIPADDPFRVNVPRARYVAKNILDLFANLFGHVEIRAEDLNADGSTNARREHVRATCRDRHAFESKWRQPQLGYLESL
jgi:hypothetical protein